MEYIPWFAWIPIVAIIGWALISMVESQNRTKLKLAKAANNPELAVALKDNAEVNRQLLQKMSELENRLATIEKTLTDIP